MAKAQTNRLKRVIEMLDANSPSSIIEPAMSVPGTSEQAKASIRQLISVSHFVSHVFLQLPIFYTYDGTPGQSSAASLNEAEPKSMDESTSNSDSFSDLSVSSSLAAEIFKDTEEDTEEGKPRGLIAA